MQLTEREALFTFMTPELDFICNIVYSLMS